MDNRESAGNRNQQEKRISAGGMTILNSAQIAQLAYKAGFRGDALNIAVAVALAESGGNTNAYNPEIAAGTPTGSGSRGLWQIYGAAHPEYNNDSAFDPQINAQAAYKVFREAGNRFTPWSTYNAGLAVPKQNYAAQIGGILTQLTGQKNNNQIASTTQKNQLSNGLQASLSGANAGGAPGNNQTVQLTNAVNQLPAAAVNAITGGRSALDLSFVVLGSFFILIALIFLLIGAAASDPGKAAIRTAATLL